MRILDLSAGNRAIWYDKRCPYTTFVDIRESVKPDIICDTTALPLEFSDFDLVVFDPPHVNGGRDSNMSRVYGHSTTAEIRRTIIGTAREAYRVTKWGGLMALKWNDHDIKLQKVFDMMPQWEPLFGHLNRNGPSARSQTYWCLLKKRCPKPT